MAMADPPLKKAESSPEGRGCLYISMAIVLIALLVFVIASWVRVPSATPQPSSTGVPVTAPSK
ncbi:MAG TPA: hypothetical protein VGX37_09580 [Allosphingosinicella sp.]|jgi:hypothetical protein|nr:hypothetical protein [Allosphingosinicella sp.]